jgi:hypothetical protein
VEPDRGVGSDCVSPNALSRTGCHSYATKRGFRPAGATKSERGSLPPACDGANECVYDTTRLQYQQNANAMQVTGERPRRTYYRLRKVVAPRPRRVCPPHQGPNLAVSHGLDAQMKLQRRGTASMLARRGLLVILSQARILARFRKCERVKTVQLFNKDDPRMLVSAQPNNR